MADSIVPKPEGRPTVLTAEAILKLEEILRIGGKIIAACAYAKISPQVYYRYLKEDEDFRNRMQSAQHYSIIAARSIVVKQMMDEKNTPAEERTKLAQWWLEKHDIKQATDGPIQNTQVNIFSELKSKYTKTVEEVEHDTIKAEFDEGVTETEVPTVSTVPEPLKNE